MTVYFAHHFSFIWSFAELKQWGYGKLLSSFVLYYVMCELGLDGIEIGELIAVDLPFILESVVFLVYTKISPSDRPKAKALSLGRETCVCTYPELEARGGRNLGLHIMF